MIERICSGVKSKYAVRQIVGGTPATFQCTVPKLTEPLNGPKTIADMQNNKDRGKK